MMNSVATKSLLVTVLMVISSIAGCISTDDVVDETNDLIEDITPIIDNETSVVQPVIFGDVMVSTYHVGELVKAVAGDHVTLHYMSQDNIPVHDYEPSLADIVRLGESDVFFYHGLNLEPWVDSTLSSMDNPPPAYMTHAMPSGEFTLDYESILVSNLCEIVSEGPFQSVELAAEEGDGHHDDDHDGHHDEDGDTPDEDGDHSDEDGDHSGDGHEDHSDEDGDHSGDGHEDHDHVQPEKVLADPANCPTDTAIQVFHMEEGEHILEFESDHDETFNFAALKMLGGHAHHHHHHGEGAFEWAGIFQIDDTSHSWSMQKVGGEYADPSMRIVLIPTDNPTEETMHTLEEGVEELIEAESCTVVEDGGIIDSIDPSGSCYELHVGNGDDSGYTIDTTGLAGLAIYAQHVPTEFERDTHYLKDSSGADVEPIAQEGGGHHDHGEHEDGHGDEDGHDDHGECHNTTTHENYESTEEDCAAAGHVWMGGDGHGDEDGHSDLPEISTDRVAYTLTFPEHMVCYDMSNHALNTSFTHEEDCTSAGMMWVSEDSAPSDHDGDHEESGEHSEVGYAIVHIDEEGDYGFVVPTDVNMYILMGEGGHEDHGDHGDHGGHGDHSDEGEGHSDEDDDHQEGEIVADTDEEEFQYDPHSWLSPAAFRAQLGVVEEALSETFPSGAPTFAENTLAFAAKLIELDTSFNSAFGEGGTCDSGGHLKTIVANHNAYSYISVRYDIDILTVHGLDPEAEPSPAEISEVVDQINEMGLTVLFVEEYTDQTAVQSIVEETGVTIEILYTMELRPSNPDDDYISMMEKNRENLISGIGC